MTYTTIDVDANDKSADGDLTVTGNIDLEGTGADTTITLDDTYDLIFEDNANTDILKIVEEGNIRLMQNADIIPDVDGQGNLGTSTNSWGSVLSDQGTITTLDGTDLQYDVVNSEDLTAATEDHALLKGATGSDLKTRAVLLAEVAGERVEHGSVAHNHSSSAADGTWDTNDAVTSSVTFSTSFSTVPDLLHGFNQGGTGMGQVYGASKTGFSTGSHQFASTGTPIRTIWWAAIGGD